MFIVTGATGQLGRAIVKSLINLVPVDQIGATCRDPNKAVDLATLGVSVRRGDFTDPESLSTAFEGASHLLIVSSNARAHGGDPLAQHQAAISAAKAAGVERIVYTSQMAASADSAFPPMRDHAATEAMLRECGMSWTALRHGFYGQSGIAMLEAALKAGVLETTQDGPVNWTAHADLADAAALILTQSERESGPTQPLTGSEAHDFGALADLASSVWRKPIKRQIIADEEMQALLAARGTPAPVVKIVFGLYLAARNGEFSTVDPTLEQLLGRRPISMRELLSK